MPLTSSISEAAVLTGGKNLLGEWLKLFFDGGNHAIGTGAPVAFPAVPIHFDQGTVPQPLNGAEIRIILKPVQEQRWWNTNGQDVRAQVTAYFWVRAAKAKEEERNFLANQVADLLYAILGNPVALTLLPDKGLAHVRPMLGNTIADDTHAMRLVSARMELWWSAAFR